MEAIRQGVLRFQRHVYPHRRKQFEQLAKGQSPQALFITCADSRVEPALITCSQPGDLFVDRNPGNFIPPFHGENASEAAGIQYALEVLKIPNIVICGHTDCGAMKAVLDPASAEALSSVKKWLVNGKEARKRAVAKKGPAEDLLRELTERNVVVQIEHLKTYPAVKAALAAGRLRIAGWVYDIGHGKVREWDEERDAFRVMGAVG